MNENIKNTSESESKTWMESSGRTKGSEDYEFGDVTRTILSKITLYLKSQNNRKIYGWRPDLPDHRDLMGDFSHMFSSLPNKIDLRPNCPKVYNQGKLGSCTANAIAAAFEYDQMKEKANGKDIDIFVPSRLFIYYCERNMEDSTDHDSGAMIRDGIKVVHRLGCCDEKIWSYDIRKFTDKPPDSVYEDALNHKCVKYMRLHQCKRTLKACLASGFPFVFGFTVLSSFETEEVAKSGKMPMPKDGDKTLGGHAVCAVGYDDEMECFIVRNSWGSEWGDEGYFYMPYKYITNSGLASDFWSIRFVE
tara:strand:+ start:853 stop:1767 length:915 start_codon:yes stop_codon:yes gene_type:complete